MAALTSLSPNLLIYILAGGILPSIFWLWFWLKEDSKKPEPRGLLLASFLSGGLMVIPAIYFEGLVREQNFWQADIWVTSVGIGFFTIISWAAIEEILKYVVAWAIDFHNNHFDEPVDTMIYLITVALGFSCVENILFIVKATHEGGLSVGLSTIAMRFIGATLLHVLASAVFGGIIALSYCNGTWSKRFYTLLGLFAATLLHALFNYFILSTGTDHTFIVFFVLWVGIILLLLFFEKIKSIVCVIKP